MKTIKWIVIGMLFLVGCGKNTMAPDEKSEIEKSRYALALSSELERDPDAVGLSSEQMATIKEMFRED